MNKYFEADKKFLQEQNGKKPTMPPCSLISEYIEGKRVLPPSTPFLGFWENRRTPYLVEIMDNMSPFSAVQHQAIMKGAQIGVTAAAENVIAYWMDENPAEIMFISATEPLLEKWGIKRLDPLIESCGYRDKIFAQTENKNSRRSGDKTFTKEFVGGALDMASAQSSASLRSDSKQILIRDEIDGAPALLRSGEGNWLDVSFARTKAFGHRKKVMDFSTPTTFENSLINRQYELGDQRKFIVPCPRCKKEIELKMGNDKSAYGLKGETKAGQLWKVYYLCEHCHKEFFNHNKTEMLTRGRWIPTARSFSDAYRSYHISSLYSPVGMFSWEELFQEFMSAVKQFIHSVDGPTCVRDLNQPSIAKDNYFENIDTLTDYADNDIVSLTSYRPMNKILYKKIYEYAWDGKDIDF